MKQEIIDFMRSQLSDNRWCKSDFENCDLKRLEEYDAEFIWAVRSSSTALVYIDADTVHSRYNQEPSRFFMFRDFYTLLSGMVASYSESVKIFHYDGKELSEVSYVKMKLIYMHKYRDYHEDMIAQYFQTYLLRNAPLEIRFMGNTEETVKEALLYAASLSDRSLLGCLERLQRYTRVAENQYIEVYNDFSKYGFTFTEMINGTPRLNGGILMSGSSDRRWSIHT